MKLSPTTDAFSGKSYATGATGIITEFVLRSPLNSNVRIRPIMVLESEQAV